MLSSFLNNHSQSDQDAISQRYNIFAISIISAVVSDQTLSEAGYEVWAPGEPNNARGDEFCGSFSRNGMFLDDPCSRGLTFFCERDAEALGCVDEQVSTQSPDEN